MKSLLSTTSSWEEHFARTGLTAKGVVYCLTGLIAFMAAFEIGGQSNGSTDKRGIFNFIQDLPAGKLLLILIAAGLLCYSIWRGIQTFTDSQNKGNDAKGLARRARYLFSGLIYLSLAFLAMKIILGSDSGGKSSNESMVAEFINKPLGQWLIGAAGIIIAGIGIYQAYYGLSEKFKKHVEKLNKHSDAAKYIMRSGTIGYVARGFVWLIISFMIMKAAFNGKSSEAGDTKKAFQFLETSSYGSYLLGALALGLILYGVFNFVRAKYEDF